MYRISNEKSIKQISANRVCCIVFLKNSKGKKNGNAEIIKMYNAKTTLTLIWPPNNLCVSSCAANKIPTEIEIIINATRNDKSRSSVPPVYSVYVGSNI